MVLVPDEDDGAKLAAPDQLLALIKTVSFKCTDLTSFKSTNQLN